MSAQMATAGETSHTGNHGQDAHRGAGDNLTLPECLILLALNDETGRRDGQQVEAALAGAGLSELAVRGFLREHHDADGKPTNRFAPARNTADADVDTGDAFLDGCFAMVRAAGPSAPPRPLIARIAANRPLNQALIDRLIAKGILRRHREKRFFLLEHETYPEAAPEPERALKAHLAAVMFEETAPTSRDCVLIALARQTGLLAVNFDPGLIATHRTRIEKIARGPALVTGASAASLSALQTAILLAVIVPVVIA
ncbi:MAG: GPP34 family phosphoprotein [Pseudomonadota bacterium]